MARLRREEESRSYERMLNPLPASEALISRYPTNTYGHLFPPAQTEEDDEMTYADVNRQMALIANVLISIIACSVAIWKVAWHWNTPARLALSMTGSIVVAVAEVAIYAGYIGRVSEAKTKERKKVEKKTVENSWVIEGKNGDTGAEKKVGGNTTQSSAIKNSIAGMRSRTANSKT